MRSRRPADERGSGAAFRSRLLRITAAALVAVVAFAAFAPASAQESDAERAAREQREQAERESAQLGAELLDLDAAVLAAVDRHETLVRRLADTRYRLASLEDAIVANEREVTELRRKIERAVAEAYMAQAAGIPVAPLAASDLGQAAVVGEVLGLSARRLSADLDTLQRALEALDRQRTEYDDLVATLAAEEREAEAARTAVEAELARVRAELAAALADLRRADDEYRRARAARLEAERRRVRTQGVEHWRPLVARYFPPERVDEALAVMRCESRGDPEAVNPYSGAAGLFQFLESTWVVASRQAGFAGASRFDPEANVAAAAWLVDHSVRTGHPRGAWGHWVCQP